jgi:alpha-tubulin suppressor-like RCC1 family protein
MTGEQHTCAIKGSGSLFCWGGNSDGELGLGDDTTRDVPVQVGSDTNWTAVRAGKYFTCGVKGAGTLFCWGINNYGQLGIGSLDSDDSPVQVGTASNWTSISTGGYQAAGLRTGGALYTWGRNAQGQLGRHVWLPLQVTAGDLPPTNRDGSNLSLALVVLAGLTAAASIGLRVRGAKRA